MTQTELGNRVGLTKSQVLKIEQGKSGVTLTRLARLEEALQVRAVLLTGDELSLVEKSRSD